MFSWSTGRHKAREERLLRNTLPVFLLQDAPVVFSTQVQGVEGVPLRGTGYLAFAVLDSAVFTQLLTGSSDSSVLKGSLQDEVRPAGVPLQCSCLCGALPFGTLSGLAAHLCLTLLTFLPATQEGELTAAPP